MPALKPELKPTMLRVAAPKSEAARVDREGGKYKAGLITGFSAISRGEALGHGIWIDETFLGQVAAAGNEMRGIKARFTHPALSSDGLGSTLGRVRNFRMEGDQVFADLHLLKAAHETPDGDLADYVMNLADESPDLFGASIVFSSDRLTENNFAAEHTDKGGRFISPDRKNKANLRHARLQQLYAADMVDDPAANPDGLFSALSSRGSLAKEAEAGLLYALGLTETEPAELLLGVHPQRAREFVTGFLARHEISFLKENKTDAVSREEFNKFCESTQARLRNLQARFENLKRGVR